jgi:type I phosphodiesterase / nucleotide pyrophosphatase
MNDLVPPDYGNACLRDLLPSIEARLLRRDPVLDVPRAARYVVLLVDGLGWFPIAEHSKDSDLFAPRLGEATRLTCAVPSTTATSLTSIGCGSAPGSHGVVGYSFLDPDRRCIVNALTWAGGPADIDGFACEPTFYQRMRSQGVTSACVSLARFRGSGLQKLAFNGTEHLGVEVEGDHQAFVGLVVGALHDHEVVYAYERSLDHSGHAHGVGSWQWLDSLARAEELVMALAEALPGDTCLLVTGDHGMVNVPKKHQITIEDHPALTGAWRVGGEPRFRQLYGEHPTRLAKAWAAELGERAEVWLRDDAIEAGWFGAVADRVRPRIGDVLVVMRDDWAVHTRALPKEFGLHGQHGSLTAAEMYVPLFAFGTT